MANQVLYGFISIQDLFDRRLTDTSTATIASAIQQSVDEHNRQMDSVFGLFVRTGMTDYKVRYKSSTVARLQPLDQNGRARPIQPLGFYDVAFPLHQAGVAWGGNRRSLAKMTVQDANDITATMLLADIRWMRDHIMAALFASTTWTFTDPEHGALSVMGLANGDTTVYQVATGNDVGGTDTHYLAQAAAIDNSNDPFPALYTELTEHPENSGEVVAIIPTNLKAAVQALAGFHFNSDSNLRFGADQTVLTGRLGVPVPGEIIGYHDAKVWISEWRSQPSNYITVVMTGGEKALAMREEPETELRGFKQVAERNDHPFAETHWERIAGFGGWNRVNAAVMRIGNASWAIPTGFTSPMA